MRRYSNPHAIPVDLGELLVISPDRNTKDMKTPPELARQTQRRLRGDEADRLVADYLAGTSIDDLAGAYGVNRTTVNAHLDRAGASRPCRLGKLSAGQIRQAVEARVDGQSITLLGAEFGVDEETVRKALRRAPASPPGAI